MLLALLIACAAPQQERVIVLGMDGLDRILLERMVEDGRLPTFARLIEEGTLADLAIARPILSPILWTSAASGYPGEIHGIGGWTDGASANSSADVRTLRLWDVASAHDLGVVVGGWLMSWPATPVAGWMLTDRFVWASPMNKDPTEPSLPDAEARHAVTPFLTFPPDLATEAEVWEPDDAELLATSLGHQVAEFGAPFHPARRDLTHLRTLLHLWDRIDPDTGAVPRLGMVHLVLADQVSHLYWPFQDEVATRRMRQDPTARMAAAAADGERHSGRRAWPWSEHPITADEIEEGARWVPEVYEALDGWLAQVVTTIDPATTTLIVMSDHGFEAGHENPVLGGGHRDPAMMLAWGRRTRAGASLEDLDILDVAPTVAALLSLPAAADQKGHARGDLFDLTGLPTIPPDPTWVLARPRVDPAAAHDPAEQALLEQLEALGYIDEERAPVLGASRDGAPSDR